MFHFVTTMKCDSLFIYFIVISLTVTSASSDPKEICDRCVELEKCKIYKEMSPSDQEVWIKKHPCQDYRKHPQKTYFGFANTAKGDYVCCPEKIWGIETNNKSGGIPKGKEHYIGYNPYGSNNDNEPRPPSNYYNKYGPGHAQKQTENPYGANQNQYPNTHSNIDEQCTVPSIFPPDPRTDCCGLEANDDERIIENQNARQNRGFGSYNNYKWPSWMSRPYSVFRERQKRTTAQKANITLDDRIAGGRETEFTDFPWTVLIKATFSYVSGPTAFNCGGSLISSRYVLTAGHCVYDKNGPLSSVDIYLAEFDKRTFPRDCKYVIGVGQKCIENIVIYGEDIILHADYDDDRLYNDISLIRLAENAPYTDYIRPICLPPIDIDSPQFSNVRLAVAGWGRNGQYQSDIKQSTVVNLVPQEECKKFYPDLTREDLCAAGYRGEDTCKGDSGGPLMTVYGGKYYVVGVVSGKRADSPCGTSVPSLYTNVYHYVNWIRSIIGN